MKLDSGKEQEKIWMAKKLKIAQPHSQLKTCVRTKWDTYFHLEVVKRFKRLIINIGETVRKQSLLNCLLEYKLVQLP